MAEICGDDESAQKLRRKTSESWLAKFPNLSRSCSRASRGLFADYIPGHGGLGRPLGRRGRAARGAEAMFLFVGRFHTGLWTITFLLGEPLPCSPAAETPLQPLMRCCESYCSNVLSFSGEMFVSQTPVAKGGAAQVQHLSPKKPSPTPMFWKGNLIYDLLLSPPHYAPLSFLQTLRSPRPKVTSVLIR